MSRNRVPREVRNYEFLATDETAPPRVSKPKSRKESKPKSRKAKKGARR